MLPEIVSRNWIYHTINSTKKSYARTYRNTLCLRGYCIRNFLCAIQKLSTLFLKNNTCFLKQIVQGTQKWN